MDKRTCDICGGDTPKRRVKYCSDRCLRLSLNRKQPLPQSFTCIRCGQDFTRPTVRGMRPKWCPGCREIPHYQRWRDAYPDRAASSWRSTSARRRAATRGQSDGESFTHEEIYERDGWKCGLCRKRIGKTYRYPHPRSASLDHVVPLIDGGEHTRANVQAAHLACNLSKNARGGGEQLRLV